MNYIPCRERLFPYKIQTANFHETYVRWLKHLGERLGIQETLSLWKETFAEYDVALLMAILSSGWRKPSSETNPGESIHTLIAGAFAGANLGISDDEGVSIVENTPPIPQIVSQFSTRTMEKEISAYEVLHLRFDAMAYLAERLIEKYGKQGELIVYDMMVEGRLAAAKGQTGSVPEFMEDFTAFDGAPNLFSAGLQTEVIRKSDEEAVLLVRECEWARYFRERHPAVGYLMACSTDEVAYRAFNRSLRMQRTQTLMEGGEMCDFRVYTIEKGSESEG